MAVGKKTGGRKKGTPNKSSRELLHLLRTDHDFDVVGEIMSLYRQIGTMVQPLVDRAIKNVSENKGPTTGMNEEEVAMINDGQKNKWTILEKLLSYCYPKFRAIEMNAGTDADKIVFNISTQGDK